MNAFPVSLTGDVRQLFQRCYLTPGLVFAATFGKVNWRTIFNPAMLPEAYPSHVNHSSGRRI